MPVFNGKKLDQGLYVLPAIWTDGEAGNQRFALGYAIPDGTLWWGLLKDDDDLDDVPSWLPTSLSVDGRYYIDTQGSSFTVELFDAHGDNFATGRYRTELDRWPDGSPTGFGWKEANHLKMENFRFGLYKETITFTDYLKHDQGARESFYFFGLKDFKQDKNQEYVIMIGVDGVSSGTASIRIQGETHSTTIHNGVALFRSRAWPFDMQGPFSIRITNKQGVSRTYHRTLVEAGTYKGYFQHQFIIVDTDFNGIEDQFE